MIARFARWSALAAATVSALVPSIPARAGVNIVDQFDVPVAMQTIHRVYPPGVYTVTAWGTFNYNKNVPGSWADAFCSTAGPGNPVDQATASFHLTPSPIAAWEPHRYDLLAPGADALELEVNGLYTQWIPVTPTPIANDEKVGPPGVGSACNEATHAYATTVVSSGGPITFRVFDPEPFDNEGFLSVAITS